MTSDRGPTLLGREAGPVALSVHVKRTEPTASTTSPAVTQTQADAPAVVAVVPRLALTPPEAAAALGCSPEYFREHIDHELRWVRRGRKRFVPVRELEEWVSRSASRLPA